jgi:hypothetical protein
VSASVHLSVRLCKSVCVFVFVLSTFARRDVCVCASGCMCARACVCMCACMFMCMSFCGACVCVCVRVCCARVYVYV